MAKTAQAHNDQLTGKIDFDEVNKKFTDWCKKAGYPEWEEQWEYIVRLIEKQLAKKAER